ncbi:hypothetical protein KKB44_01520 [Candidatus Micrarchaeota archaeon]|nr:hypothetical protein [Candidatus Micrarchaeota archaeon]
MEAWMEPTKNVYGRPWPPCVLIYKGDIISWHLKWPDLLEYGKYLIDKFVEANERTKLLAELDSQVKYLENLFAEIDNLTLTELQNADLLETYKQIYDAFVRWFVPGALVEPIGHKGERLIQEVLSSSGKTEKQQKEMLCLLTTTTKESFSKRELKDLLEIAIRKKKGDEIDHLLEQHMKKYFWLHNNYFSTEVLDTKFFENEVKLILKKYPDPDIQIQKLASEASVLKSRKAELLKKLNSSEFDANLIELLDLFAWYQDYRKEYVMQILHYLDQILAEIGRRKNYTLKEMKYTLPEEIPKIFENSFDIDLVRERMKHYLFYFDGKGIEQGVGLWSLEKEKELLKLSSHDAEIIEIKGMVASKGYVKGKARVTMSAEEAKTIQKGEILITSMTSPDFVTAIKRAAAIVTNEGGILCHAAVVSREFDIPCIVGTRLATKVFKTGDLIEVDGELGVIRRVFE